MQPGHGSGFALTRDSAVVVATPCAGAVQVASDLAAQLRAATGYPLPVEQGHGKGRGADIVLDLDRHAGGKEGYRLDVGHKEARLTAETAEGLFRGVQTLRQLLPPKVESSTTQPGPWTIAPVKLKDSPRFGWRGAMVDVARHFMSVAEIKRYVDLISRYKVNTLHLHLSDDQGWRIAIDSWPRLAPYGGSLEVGGTPGGSYSKADYRDIVDYAARRYITVIPEIDTPGHTNAALASYAELNCDGVAPPLYTGIDVGFSSLCVGKDLTYKFLDDVIGELAALTPGPFIDIGGDEAESTTDEDYVTFVDRVQDIVHKHGKRMSGWHEIVQADTASSSVAQYWNPAAGSEDGTELARTAVAKHVPLVMSPANHAYLDMKYDESTPLGLSWAGLVEVRDAYDWDPATLVDGVGERDILGVEAPIWTETLDEIADVEFMAFPRLPAIAEIGWSPQSARSWDDFRVRLGAQGPRWEALGVNFYRSPQVPWG